MIQDSSDEKAGEDEMKNAPPNKKTAGDDVRKSSDLPSEIKVTPEESAGVSCIEGGNSRPNAGHTMHEGAGATVKTEMNPNAGCTIHEGVGSTVKIESSPNAGYTIHEGAGATVKTEIGPVESDDTKTGTVDAKSEPGFKIFVGGLEESVTEEDLRTFMINETKCNEDDIQTCTITCQIVKNSKKYGIAFVDFSNEETYKVALTLNNASFKGSTIHVLPSHKTHEGIMFMDGIQRIKEEPKDALDAAAQVPVYKKSDHVAYIKNLPQGIGEDEVLELFKFTRADIVDMSVPLPFRPKRNAKRPMRAIIAFRTEELLQKCLAQSKTVFRDREVIVDRYHCFPKVSCGEKRAAPGEEGEDREECGGAAPPPQKQLRLMTDPKDRSGTPARRQPACGQLEMDLFVKHVPREASDQHIRDFFNAAGATVVKINHFPESAIRSTRGMCFVTMLNKESVKRGLLLDCKRFQKVKVLVAHRRDREHLMPLNSAERIPNYCTFVSNLPIKKKPEELKLAISKHFEAPGKCTIREVHVPLPANRSGNRGYAFVIFDDESSLKRALGLNGTLMKLQTGDTKITVNDHWPERRAGGSGGGSNKAEGGGHHAGGPEQSFGGKWRKRFERNPPPPPRPPPLASVFGTPPVASPVFQLAPLAAAAAATAAGSPFAAQDYLDFLEYRNYVATRKTLDERRRRLGDFVEPWSGTSPSQARGAAAATRERDGGREMELMYARHGGGGGGGGGYAAGASGPGGFADCGGSRSEGGGGGSSGGGSDRGGFGSSLNSSIYQSAPSSSTPRSRLLNDSMVSSTVGSSRDTDSFPDSSHRSDRRGGGSSTRFSSEFSSGNRDNAREYQSLSNVRSGHLDSARPQYGSTSYSELSRGNTYGGGGGIEETAGFSSGGGDSYSGNEERYSYSPQGERRYSDYGDSSQRKAPLLFDPKAESRYEDSDNTVYNSAYPGIRGYRVG